MHIFVEFAKEMAFFGGHSRLQLLYKCLKMQRQLIPTLLKSSSNLNSTVSARHLSVWRKINSYIQKGAAVPVNYDIVLPGNVSSSRKVPPHISQPGYAASGFEDPAPLEIDLKDQNQQERMRKSCNLAKFILDETVKQIGVGVTTDELDVFVHDLCIEQNCYPSPLNYRGFPKSVCTAVNNVAVHGIPDDRALKDGDIISVDISVFYNGYHGDCATTCAVGNVDVRGHNLMRVAEECLQNAIAICGPEQPFSEIGSIISKTANDFGFKVIPAFCGHGIGTYFHGQPDIFHFDNKYPGIMKEGMIFTIEPVITEGGPDIIVLEDGWTAVTLDNRRTAQYEHTILITSTGSEILTASQCGLR